MEAAAAKVAGNILSPNERRGSSNTMSFANKSGVKIKMKQYFINHGKSKKTFSPSINAGETEVAIFKTYSDFSTRGTSGIITFQLDDKTWLHVLWDCPYTFKLYDNFIALYLCKDPNVIPNKDLFYRMEQKTDAGIKPKEQSTYDLVCCGPGTGTFLGSSGKAGEVNWGIRRTCVVKNDKFHVTMTMGDSHQTTSKVIVESNV